MGLLDFLRRPAPAPPPTTPEEWKARGRLEAEVERLSLEWLAYRDEIKRLVARLEKRDQRAAQATPQTAADGEDLPLEVARARLLRGRRQGG